jgi:hypothetical protein
MTEEIIDALAIARVELDEAIAGLDSLGTTISFLVPLPARAFFAPPADTLPSTTTPQDRLLHLAGRKP